MLGLLQRAFRALTLRARSAVALLNARRDSRERLARLSVQRVLVVCYGNIYRSAFVGELLKTTLPSAQVRSGGFHPVEGRPSPPRHVELCRKFEVSLESHRSSVLTPEDLAWADLILLMDRHNWAALRALGAREDKLVWLGSLLPGQVEIPDPYTLSDAAAERIVQRMRATTDEFVRSMRIEQTRL